MPSIFVGIPCYGTMPPETEEDYMRLMYYLGRRYHEYDFLIGILRKKEQFRARNSIVEAAFQCQADYVWMLDDDHVIDIDSTNAPSDRYEILHKLLAHFDTHPDAGIVGALYYHRGGECRPVVMDKIEDKYIYLRDDQIKHKLQEVAVTGGGCMLIKSKVFDRIGIHPFAPEHEYGTDIQVCKAAAEQGFGVYCDTSVEIGHVKNEMSVVTSKNKHEHYQKTQCQNDDIAASARMRQIMAGFRADVKEYLGIDDDTELMTLANKYLEHQKKFDEYKAADRIKVYYIDSGPAYLARACFIHGGQEDRQGARFDDFVLQTVKGDYPGVGIDYGCGSAPITFELARQGQQIYFYDIDGSAPYEFLKWRAKKYNLYGLQAMFGDDWPAPESVDYALCLDSIEHLEHWREVLDNIAGCLRHAGCLITNYMLLADFKNDEHISMDKPAVMEHLTRLRLWPINTAIFTKREDFAGAK